MPDQRFHPLWWRSLLAATLFLGLLGGCDNPTCVFSSTCFDDPLIPEGALGSTAVEPLEGELILTAVPTIVAAAPTGLDRHSTTPVILTFSETMSPGSVTSAFEIVDTLSNIVRPSNSQLFAAGRVLVVLPTIGLSEGEYELRLVDGAMPIDLGGAALDFTTGVDLPTFSIGATDPVEPAVVAVYPPAGSTNASSSPEILCIFDRSMAAPLNLAAGWDVLVAPDNISTPAAPTFDPDPAAPTTPGFLGLPIPEPRIFVWQSLDGTFPARVTTSGGLVSVSISPSAAPFVDLLDGAQAAPVQSFSFNISAAPRPMVGMLNPDLQLNDAIGIANLDGVTAARNLELQVDFESDDLAASGDILTVFMFGADPDDATNTIGFSRSVSLASGVGIMSTKVELALLDLVISSSPLNVRFGDGAVRFAMRIERGGDQGYVRLLDVDLAVDGVQDPLLDTIRPELLLLDGQSTTSDEFVSDQTDLVIVGHADVELGDFIRGAEVTTTGMGDNITTMSVIPDVLGSSDSLVITADGPILFSFFIAAPVNIGRLAPTTAAFNATVTVYDRALNASVSSLTVPFRQTGAIGSNPLDAADSTPLIVEVFDIETLLPIEGALVYSHAEVDDGIGNLSYTMLTAGGVVTNASGVTNTIPHHDSTATRSQIATLVTVVAAGYDALTFHGVPTDRISIPLTPVQQIPGTERNSVIVSPGVNLTTLTRRVADTRRSDLLFPTSATSSLPGVVEFEYDIFGLRPFRFGAQSFMAGVVDGDINNAGKDRLIKAFDLRIPVDGQETSVSIAQGALRVTELLDDPASAASGVAKAVSNVSVDATSLDGMDPHTLVSDTNYGRLPLVTIEATLPGVDRPLPVGMGTAYDENADMETWDLRSAYAGAADPTTGTLIGVLDSDLHLRVELRSEDATTMLPLSISGMRPDISQLAALDPLVMPDIPEVTSMATDGTGILMAPGFDLTFRDEVDDTSGLTLDGRGIYRVVLTDVGSTDPGRRWMLYKLDEAGATSVTVHFPDLGGDPVPIPALGNATTVQVSSFAWEAFPTFATAETLMWTDIGREVEAYAHTELVPFTLQ